MKFILYLPFSGKAGPARIGKYARSHEHGGRLIFGGNPIEVDPFDKASVAAFNELLKREFELAFELGRRVYPLPPRLEMVIVQETEVVPEEPPEPTLRRKPGRRPRIDFAALEPIPTT